LKTGRHLRRLPLARGLAKYFQSVHPQPLRDGRLLTPGLLPNDRPKEKPPKSSKHATWNWFAPMALPNRSQLRAFQVSGTIVTSRQLPATKYEQYF
jgi:hypothetical protein